MPSRKKQWGGAPVALEAGLLRAALALNADNGFSVRSVARRMARSYFGSSAKKGDENSISSQIGYLVCGKQARCGMDFLKQLARALGYPKELLSDVDGSFRARLWSHWTLVDLEQELSLPGRVELAKYNFWREVGPALERDFPSKKERSKLAELLDQLPDPAHWRSGLHLPRDYSLSTIRGKAAKESWRPSEAEEAAWANLIDAMRQILQPWIQGVTVDGPAGAKPAQLNVRGLWLVYRALQAPESLPKKHERALTGAQRRRERIALSKKAGFTVVSSEAERAKAKAAGKTAIAMYPPAARREGKSISWREWRDLE